MKLTRNDIPDANDCDCDEDNTCGCSFPNNTETFSNLKQANASEPAKPKDGEVCFCDTKGDCDCDED